MALDVHVYQIQKFIGSYALALGGLGWSASHLTTPLLMGFLADRYGIIPTGGSDCHGIPGGAGGDVGEVDVPMTTAERMFALAERLGTLARS